MKNYKRELEVAQHLAVQAGNAILPIYYGAMDIVTKPDNTPVTNADVLANRIILEGINKAFPLDGIVSEELETIEGDRCWYIDPIDGTRGFIEHTDQFAVHIGLAVEENAVLGIVYKPIAKEMYYAVKDHGAYRSSPYHNPQQIHVREHENLIAAMDLGDSRSSKYQTLEKMLPIKRTIISGSEGLRVMKVAEGIADLHAVVNPNGCGTWDVCGPQAIAEEAGAHISYTNGQPILYSRQRKLGKTFMVTNSKSLADRICEMVGTR
ncbi:MAG TPA: 3'(2'),5'-bisphosphate nucleotidase CysQ [Candidatus Nanoarchaeia archaeon]|nr:3'(2'),5'-bisphosphate nucleotidase CysQ [Candidatus Nanoarchaeia archaeon]